MYFYKISANAVFDALLEKIESNKELFEEGKIAEWDIKSCHEYLKEDANILKDGGCETIEEYIEKYCRKHYTDLMTIFNEVEEILISKYGFSRLQFQQKVSFDASIPIINKEEHNKEDIDNADIILDMVADMYWKKKEEQNG